MMTTSDDLAQQSVESAQAEMTSSDGGDDFLLILAAAVFAIFFGMVVPIAAINLANGFTDVYCQSQGYTLSMPAPQ